MSHALTLFESRPWWELEPDQRHQFVGEGHWDSGADDGVQAAATRAGDTLIAYLPRERREIRVDLERMSGERVRAHWFDPRTGQSTLIGAYDRIGSRLFSVPEEGEWVLVVDAEAKGYAAPGTTAPEAGGPGPPSG